MRSWFAYLLIPCGLGAGGASLAQTADSSKLPEYFTQSFDAVNAAPLQVVTPETKPGAAAAAIVNPGETTVMVSRPAQTAATAKSDGAMAATKPAAPVAAPPQAPLDPV